MVKIIALEDSDCMLDWLEIDFQALRDVILEREKIVAPQIVERVREVRPGTEPPHSPSSDDTAEYTPLPDE